MPVVFLRKLQNYCNYWATEQMKKRLKLPDAFSFVGPWLPIDTHFAIGNFIKSVTTNSDIVIQAMDLQ